MLTPVINIDLDACSPAFDKHEPRRSNHIENIRIATEYLTNSVIPKAVVWLDKHAEKMSISEVLEYLHASGINFRYMKNAYSIEIVVNLAVDICHWFENIAFRHTSKWSYC